MLCGDKLIFEKLSKYIEIALFAKEKGEKGNEKSQTFTIDIDGINIICIKNQR